MGLIFNRVLCPVAALLIHAAAPCAFGQHPAADPTPTDAAGGSAAVERLSGAPAVAGVDTLAPIDKRILGVMPNYRTVQDTGLVAPISTRKKFWIASKDSFDYPVWLVAMGLSGVYQLKNSNPDFGQGLKGYFKRYGASFADQSLANMLTEGVFPCVLHEDPRYFRRGTGATWRRAGYALTSIFVTHTDAGATRFNFSEFIGNSIAVAVSNAYYPQTRTARDNLEKVSMELGIDSISNVAKEFWPDVKRK